MVLGISRARPRFDARGMFILGSALPDAARQTAWAENRGATHLKAAVDASGGFPGFAQSGVALRSAQFQISDSYLLMDEGESRGFGLPIQWLDGAAVVARTGREAPGLRIYYRDGAAVRHFTVRFRRSMHSLRPHRDAERVRHLLLNLGLPDRPEDRYPSVPDVRVSWEDARRFEQENVIWRGKASAPSLVGEDSVPADVWLTTRSIIWGPGEGDGLNRLSLDTLIGVVSGQADSGAAVPALYLAFVDTAAGAVQFDLPFVFDQYSAERNVRERGAFLVALRSRGVSLGLPAPLIQPWRSTLHLLDMTSDSSIAAGPSDGVQNTRLALPVFVHRYLDRLGDLSRRSAESNPRDARPNQLDSDDTPRTVDGDRLMRVSGGTDECHDSATAESDRFLAEFPAPTEPDSAPAPPAAMYDVAIASEWSDPEMDDAGGRDGEARELGDEPIRANLGIRDADRSLHLEQTSAYEAALLSLLSEALIAIRDRAAGLPRRPLRGTAPTHLMERAALGELERLATTGRITSDDAELRRVRLTAISEAARRLRSLVELHDAGHFTAADLAIKRAEISAELSGFIVSGSSQRGNP